MRKQRQTQMGAMMTFDLASLWAEAKATVADPRAGARRVMAMNLPLNAAVMALVIVAILTALISAMVSMMASGLGAQDMPMATLTPLQWAGLQVFGMFLGAGAITYVGRWFGGYGTLEQAVALLAWAEFIILIVQIAQVAALFILPPISIIFALIGVALTFWLIVNFIAEMHGFTSLIKVFFGIIATGFAMTMVFSVLAAMFVGT